MLIEMRHPPAKLFQPFPFPKVSFETASTDEPTRETNSIAALAERMVQLVISSFSNR